MKIAVYGTSDLHGYVYPTNYIDNKEQGILKICSYILEDEKNYHKSLKIDCGDLIQGSPFTQYLSKNDFDKNPVIEIMKRTGFDAYVLGNHEFNYGIDYLKKSYEPICDKVINANINGLPIDTNPYKIFDIDGFKIGCIGLTTSYIPYWEKKENIEGVKFLNPVECYKKYEDELKNKCDFIIVCYHGGFEKSIDGKFEVTEPLTGENVGSELLEKFDSINLVLSGHQHRSFAVKIRDVICTQPMNNGIDFAKIVIDTDTKEVEFGLIEVKNTMTEINKELEEISKDTEMKLEKYLNVNIGTFDKNMVINDLFEARLKGHPFINFLNDIQLQVSEADISAVSIFDTAIGFEKQVTVKDVLINYPYANTLKVLKVKGDKVKEAIEKSATYFDIEDEKPVISREFLFPKRQSYNYDMFAGIEYVLDIRRPHYDRVISLTKDGSPINMDEYYTVVMSSYRAGTTSVYPAYEGAEIIKEINVDISELLIEYISSHPNIKINEKNCYKVIY